MSVDVNLISMMRFHHKSGLINDGFRWLLDPNYVVFMIVYILLSIN